MWQAYQQRPRLPVCACCCSLVFQSRLSAGWFLPAFGHSLELDQIRQRLAAGLLDTVNSPAEDDLASQDAEDECEMTIPLS